MVTLHIFGEGWIHYSTRDAEKIDFNIFWGGGTMNFDHSLTPK